MCLLSKQRSSLPRGNYPAQDRPAGIGLRQLLMRTNGRVLSRASCRHVNTGTVARQGKALLFSLDVTMEPKSPKKLQFATPAVHGHLDPDSAEQIRRRRPTPANLVLTNAQTSAEENRNQEPQTVLEVHTAATPSPKQRKQSVYTPPIVTELQCLLDWHLDSAVGKAPKHSPVDPFAPSPPPAPCGGVERLTLAKPPSGRAMCRCRASGVEGQENGTEGAAQQLARAGSSAVGQRDRAASLRDSQAIDAETEPEPQKPRRKDTPVHRIIPHVPGVRLLKSNNNVTFVEEDSD